MEFHRNTLVEWLGSNEAAQVRDVFDAINLHNHGADGRLRELYGDEVVDQLPTYGYDSREELRHIIASGRVPQATSIDIEQLAPLEAVMPITDVYHAAYLIIGGQLLLSRPGTYLLPMASEMDAQLDSYLDSQDLSLQYQTGMIAKVKSLGIKVFDPGRNIVKRDIMKVAAGGLERRGITLFHREKGVYVFP